MDVFERRLNGEDITDEMLAVERAQKEAWEHRKKLVAERAAAKAQKTASTKIAIKVTNRPGPKKRRQPVNELLKSILEEKPIETKKPRKRMAQT